MTASAQIIVRDDAGRLIRIIFGQPVKIEACQRAAAVESLNAAFDRDMKLQEAIRETYPHRD